jgi:hypothetical protein
LKIKRVCNFLTNALGGAGQIMYPICLVPLFLLRVDFPL